MRENFLVTAGWYGNTQRLGEDELGTIELHRSSHWKASYALEVATRASMALNTSSASPAIRVRR